MLLNSVLRMRDIYPQMYYNWIMRVRNKGDWEGWLKFFLRGLIEVYRQAVSTARPIIDLQNYHMSMVMHDINTPNAMKLLDMLFMQPVLSITDAQKGVDISYPTASNLITKFVEVGILQEKTGQQRNRSFAYTEYLNILNDNV